MSDKTYCGWREAGPQRDALRELLRAAEENSERLRTALEHATLRAYDHGYSAGVHDSRTEDDAARMTRNETIDSIVADALGDE